MSDHCVVGHHIDPSCGPTGPVLFHPVPHNWHSKGTKDCCVYYVVCGTVHVEDFLLLIGKKSMNCWLTSVIIRVVLSCGSHAIITVNKTSLLCC